MVKSFSQRRAAAEKAEALETMTVTERLLAHILIELFDARAHWSMHERAQRLKQAWLSTQQAAALLDTTPATLAVLKRRESAQGTAEGKP